MKKSLIGALCFILLSGLCVFGQCPGEKCQDAPTAAPIYPTPPNPKDQGGPDPAPTKENESSPDVSLFKDHPMVDALGDYFKSRPDFIVVSPERPTPVKLSSSDMNRLTCTDGPIKDINYSGEKGLLVKISGREAYIKFRALKSSGKTIFARNPTELIINCNDRIYTLITLPDRIPTQTVRLGSKTDALVLSGMAIEQKILSFVKAVYTGQIPDAFTVTLEKKPKDLNIFKDIELIPLRVVTADGEGLKVREFEARVRPRSSLVAIDLAEGDFLTDRIGKEIFAISIEKPHLTPQDVTRIFIVEAHHENN
jgi:conjugal transfer pilus assembly protein TraK